MNPGSTTQGGPGSRDALHLDTAVDGSTSASPRSSLEPSGVPSIVTDTDTDRPGDTERRLAAPAAEGSGAVSEPESGRLTPGWLQAPPPPPQRTRSARRFPHSPRLDTKVGRAPKRAASATASPSGASRAETPPPAPRDLSEQATRLPSPPRTAAPTAEEQKDITSHLAKKRSRKLLRRKAAAQNSDDSDDTIPVDELAALRRQADEACVALRSKHVDLVFDGRTVHSALQLGDMDVPSKSYVWEVMYENQRGLTMFGKAWYSANTLLPSDPTPYTLPQTLPTTEVTEAVHGQTATRKSQPKRVRKSIKTGYTLETYQTPSPAWVWLTPWMVNMREQTDEQGWEYNLWFHSSSWRAHPGHFNWWGWVRRREWVRLRGVVPEIVERANEEMRDAADDFWRESRHSSERESRIGSRAPTPGAKIGDITPIEEGGVSLAWHLAWHADDTDRNSDRTSTTTNASTTASAITNPRQVGLGELLAMPHPVHDMVRLLGLAPLDREKHAALMRWIDRASENEVEELKQLLAVPANVELVARAFVFGTSRDAVLKQLVARGIIAERVCNDCLTSPAPCVEECEAREAERESGNGKGIGDGKGSGNRKGSGDDKGSVDKKGDGDGNDVKDSTHKNKGKGKAKE